MQTASQMMAAKRAAKKESSIKKYARENIGNKRADRNKLANIANNPCDEQDGNAQRRTAKP